MTLRMIQPMGKRPYAAPKSAALAAIAGGIPMTAIATRSAIAKPSDAAMYARTRRAARRPSRTSSGSAAASIESAALPNGE